MTILLVSHTSELHGAERSLLDLARGLKKQNLDFIVLCPTIGDLPAILYEEDISVCLINLRRPMRSPLNLIKFILLWFPSVIRLFLFIRRNQVKVVYNNTIDGLYGPFAARLAGIPCIWHVREVKPKGRESRLIFRWLLQQIPTKVVFNSYATRYAYGKTDLDHWTVIYNGIAVAELTPSRVEKEPKREVVVGFAGQLVPHKRPDRFIKALAAANKVIPSIRGLIAGSGELKDELYKLILETGLDDTIDLLGSVDQMKKFYERIDMLVLTSEFEPFGRVLIEAMAMGKPVIAAAVDGVPEVVEDDVVGFLVDADDIGEYSVRICTLASDFVLRRRMGLAANKHVRDNFSIETYQNSLTDLLCQYST